MFLALCTRDKIFDVHVKLCLKGYAFPVLIEVKLFPQFKCWQVLQCGCLHGWIPIFLYLNMGRVPVFTCTSVDVICIWRSSISRVCSSVGESFVLTSSCRNVVCHNVQNVRVGSCIVS